MLNKAQVIGNLTGDPESRPVGDTTVTNFTVATNWKTKDKEGVDYLRVAVWGANAENCKKYLSKGSKVFVEGKNEINMYEKDGVKHYPHQIRAERVIFLDKKGENSGAGASYDDAPRVENDLPSGGADATASEADIPEDWG